MVNSMVKVLYLQIIDKYDDNFYINDEININDDFNTDDDIDDNFNDNEVFFYAKHDEIHK